MDNNPNKKRVLIVDDSPDNIRILMETLKGAQIVYVQIAGFIARRIVCYAREGDQMTSGQRMGIIRFGSRVDVYFPANAEIHVGLKQKVTAGESLLAVLHSKNSNKT